MHFSFNNTNIYTYIKILVLQKTGKKAVDLSDHPKVNEQFNFLSDIYFLPGHTYIFINKLRL